MQPPSHSRRSLRERGGSGGGSRGRRPSQHRALLISDRYFAEMRALTREGLQARQAHSLASLGFGAAGVAFSHWYVGTRRSDLDLLAEARRWLAIAESF